MEIYLIGAIGMILYVWLFDERDGHDAPQTLLLVGLLWPIFLYLKLKD